MLGTLLESNARPPRRGAGMVASIAIHTVLIGGALAATAAAKSRDRRGMEPPPAIVYTPSTLLPAQPAPRRKTGRRAIAADAGRLPDAQRAIRYVPESLLGRTIDVDTEQPLELDAGAPTCLVRCDRSPGGEAVGAGGLDTVPATVATVDRGAALISPPRPRYPEQLRAAGVTGRVVVRLVVDTVGRVEPGTAVVREASHDLFAREVLAILPALRFVAARAGARKVRMLVDLPFEFRLNE